MTTIEEIDNKLKQLDLKLQLLLNLAIEDMNNGDEADGPEPVFIVKSYNKIEAKVIAIMPGKNYRCH